MNPAVLSNVSIHNVFLYCARDTGETHVWLWGSLVWLRDRTAPQEQTNKTILKYLAQKMGWDSILAKAMPLPQVEIIPKQTL